VNKNIFECFTLLSAISAITTKIKIGQIVACNCYRNTALLAKMISTLDVISNGRVELGIGAGWYEQEFRAYGYNFQSDITRIKQLDESLSIIKEIQDSVVLPCIIRESEEEANQILMTYKRKDKTIEQYIEYLVEGITIGNPEKISRGIRTYTDIGVTHFILHFIGLNERALRLFHS